MTDKSETELREAGKILGLEIDEQHHPEEVEARLFLLLAQRYQELAEEIQLLKEPLGTPAQRSSLQRAEDQAGSDLEFRYSIESMCPCGTPFSVKGGSLLTRFSVIHYCDGCGRDNLLSVGHEYTDVIRSEP